MTKDEKLLALLGEAPNGGPLMLGRKLCYKDSFEYFDHTGTARADQAGGTRRRNAPRASCVGS